MRPEKLTIAILAGTIGLLPVLPPEHVHNLEDHAGRPHLIVHSHVESHGLNRHHHRGATLDDSDPIITLEPWLSAPVPVFDPTVILTAVTLVEPPSMMRGMATTELIQHRTHGPPGAPSGLRSPPFLLSL